MTTKEKTMETDKRVWRDIDLEGDTDHNAAVVAQLKEIAGIMPVPTTLSIGVEDWFPTPMVDRYTNAFVPLALPSVNGNPALQRILYARSIDRKVDVVEYEYHNGRWVAVIPPEFNGDSSTDGKAVAPVLVLIQQPNWVFRVRLYAIVERLSPYAWVPMFTWPDLPIFFDYGQMIRNIMAPELLKLQS